MNSFTLPYGRENISINITKEGYQGTFLPTKILPTLSQEEILAQALQDPIGTEHLRKLVRNKENVVIVTSDLTRPCPNQIILPPLIKELNDAGIPDENISIVIALGLHRKMSEDELRLSVGEELYGRIRVLNHDLADVVSLGTTGRGTPVEIFRHVAEADFRICVGNVEFHYFAGYSGGAKAIMPGVASRQAVNANHAHMIKAAATAAYLRGNPVREDLEEAVELIGVDFIFNVVVDEEQRIIHASAGHVTKAHRVLCQKLEAEGLVPLPKQLDLAIVSAGGYPKDLDLYQAQKALDNCAGVVRPGGVLILLAHCEEGYGNATFAEWMTGGHTTHKLLESIQAKFVLGGHKAAAIAKVASEINVFLVTGQVLQTEKMTGIKLASSWQGALNMAESILGQHFTYGVFPLGASTLPKLVK